MGGVSLNRWFSIFATALLVATFCRSAPAEPTPVDVHVIAKGSKFVGTSMGGAEIVIRDADTAEILAQGKTSGSTGDTFRIMMKPSPHHASISTDDAAVFHAVLDIDRPRRIEVTARGPLAQPQAINTTSATQWIVPGRALTGGDGLLLTLPGLVVDVLAPPAGRKLSGTKQSVPLRANVRMICGCPITPDGLWPAEKLEVAAIIYRDGVEQRLTPLEYAGQPSQFETVLEIDKAGVYEVVVFAHDPTDGNTGVDKATIVVSE